MWTPTQDWEFNKKKNKNGKNHLYDPQGRLLNHCLYNICNWKNIFKLSYVSLTIGRAKNQRIEWGPFRHYLKAVNKSGFVVSVLVQGKGLQSLYEFMFFKLVYNCFSYNKQTHFGVFFFLCSVYIFFSLFVKFL